MHVPGYFLEPGEAPDALFWNLATHLPWTIVIGAVLGVWAVLGGNIWLPTVCHLLINAGFLFIGFGPAAQDENPLGLVVALLRPVLHLGVLRLFTLLLFPPRREVWAPLIGPRAAPA